MPVSYTKYWHLSENGEVVVKDEAGVLHRVVVNRLGSGKIGSGSNLLTLLDGVETIAAIDATALLGCVEYGIPFTRLTATLAGGKPADVTIVFE